MKDGGFLVNGSKSLFIWLISHDKKYSARNSCALAVQIIGLGFMDQGTRPSIQQEIHVLLR